MPDKEFFKCACGSQHFSGARRLFFAAMADGTKLRQWEGDVNNGTVIECVKCHTTYKWSSKASAYEVYAV